MIKLMYYEFVILRQISVVHTYIFEFVQLCKIFKMNVLPSPCSEQKKILFLNANRVHMYTGANPSTFEFTATTQVLYLCT
jgi:hypothetical protein